MYVTPAMMREHSRVDAGNASDEYLEMLTGAAEETVAWILQVDSLSDVAYDSGALPAPLVQAIMMLAATLYENRESEAPVEMHPSPAFERMVRTYVRYKG